MMKLKRRGLTRERRGLTRGWLIVIVASAVAVLLVKLYLALTSEGSADVIGFADHLAKIRELGGIRTYGVKGPFNNPFNSPPFMIHVLRVLGLLTDATRLPFSFWLRLPSILADTLDLFLVWRILGLSRVLPRSPFLLLLLVLCPVSIMVSGFHGSTDPLMIFFVLLSIYLIEKQEQRLWLAGIALGVALSIKVAPLILAPALCFYLTGTRKRIVYFGAAAATFIVGALPYVLMDASILAKVFGYSSLYGQWGWSALLARFYPEAPRYLNPPHDVIGIHAVFAAIGKWSMLLIIVAVSVWMNRRAREKPPLMLQCGLIFALFLFLTPGFGIQYLSWLVPLIVALDVWPTLLFYLTAGLYQLMGYTCWAERAAPPHICLERDTALYVMLQCWGALLALSLIYLYRMSARGPHASADHTR